MQWDELRENCEWYLAREIARPRVKLKPNPDRVLSDGLDRFGIDQWAYETKLALPEASSTINRMTNLELLDLIGKVIARNA